MYRTKVRVNNPSLETTASDKGDGFTSSDTSMFPLPINSRLILENPKIITENGTFKFEE